MLELKSITKDYGKGDSTVHALRGVDVAFRKSEFVSILGHSGCGKTTLLNIIGGLDRYTNGDLVIKGYSTKGYSDRDWDYYRNHSIGFVFQSYNLIGHQTILANVELSLTISGVSRKERKARAIEALSKVGLKDQIHKKPNQLSGGQMQRVAIARALVNEPEILLADEPTGALDTDTSIQIMELLKEIAKDRLVIMVTHNPDLAKEYSTRIIRLVDGVITDDDNPVTQAELDEEYKEYAARKKKKRKKTSMSFFTALNLSLNNLMTKKARTILTALAGSIGIIGIALIMSLSNGFQEYINRVEKDTLSSYPVTLDESTMDYTSMLESMSGKKEENSDRVLDRVYTSSTMADMMNLMNSSSSKNNLEKFKKYIESGESGIEEYSTAIQYSYNTPFYIYNADNNFQVQPFDLYEEIGMTSGLATLSSNYSYGFNQSNWQELIQNEELLESQYDVLVGRWPQAYNEIVIFVNSQNEIEESAVYELGLKDKSEIPDLMDKISKGEELDTETHEYSYDEIMSLEYKLILSGDLYKADGNGGYTDMTEDEEYMSEVIAEGTTIKVVGIMRPNDQSVSTAMGSTVGYTHELTEYAVNNTNELDIVKEQQDNPDIDVFTGKPFADSDKAEDISFDMTTLSPEQQMYFASLSEEEQKTLIESYAASMVSEATYEGNLEKLGLSDLDKPSGINIYPKDFDSKEAIQNIIDEYNQKQKEEGNEADVISYTDIVGTFLSSVTTIVNTVSYVLIAFVAISLVVSSIMIGIITYISVLERTKEIGILRSMGASKKDISRVFNAETVIIGFISGAMGIGITLILNIPINAIIKSYTNIAGVSALPVVGAVSLIAISVVLTLIAGLIPSGFAAKRDPVVALRTE